MGFYIEARNDKGHAFSSKSYQVWNPNVEHLYVSLGLENPQGEFSGNKEELSFSLTELEKAYSEVENISFYEKEQREDLHPILAHFASFQPAKTFDIEDEKEKLLRFFEECIKVAKSEGHVTLYFG